MECQYFYTLKFDCFAHAFINYPNVNSEFEHILV
jgi:hypothetical protein